MRTSSAVRSKATAPFAPESVERVPTCAEEAEPAAPASGAYEATEAGQQGVNVIIRNDGKVAGDEVAQLYLSFPQAPGMPPRAQPRRPHARESRRIHFDLAPRDLSSVIAAGKRIVARGAYQVTVGGGQPGTGAHIATTRFTVTGDMRCLMSCGSSLQGRDLFRLVSQRCIPSGRLPQLQLVAGLDVGC